MTEIVLLDPQDQAIITVDWLDLLEDGLTLNGDVVHIVPTSLTKVSESTDGANKRSFVKVSGAVHGQLYSFEAQATLSNGEVINRNFPVRCFNG